MTTITLFRFKTSNQGTLGVWLDPFLDVPVYSIELPWRDNRPNISCIPHGEYNCQLVKSPKFGKVYEIENVPGRSHILIHSANVAGDVLFGYKTHLQGCVALGKTYGKLFGQDAVLSSRPAIKEMIKQHQGESFILKIMGT